MKDKHKAISIFQFLKEKPTSFVLAKNAPKATKEKYLILKYWYVPKSMLTDHLKISNMNSKTKIPTNPLNDHLFITKYIIGYRISN